MTIQRMEHVGIVVDDLDAATAFFGELGLKLQGEGQVEGGWVDRVVGLEGVRVEYAMMETPDGHGRLELVKFHSPSVRGGDGHAPATSYQPPLRARLSRLVLPVYTALAVAYLFLPIAVMIAFSFNNPRGRQNITWQGFTLQNYIDVWSRPDITNPMLQSLIVAVVSTILATILGTLIGLALTRYRFVGRNTTNILIFLPMATPEIIMGASLLSLWVSRP